MNTSDSEQLRIKYEALTNEDLLRLAATLEDLTPQASLALKMELKRRRLGDSDVAPYLREITVERQLSNEQLTKYDEGYRKAEYYFDVFFKVCAVGIVAGIVIGLVNLDAGVFFGILVVGPFSMAAWVARWAMWWYSSRAEFERNLRGEP